MELSVRCLPSGNYLETRSALSLSLFLSALNPFDLVPYRLSTIFPEKLVSKLPTGWQNDYQQVSKLSFESNLKKERRGERVPSFFFQSFRLFSFVQESVPLLLSLRRFFRPAGNQHQTFQGIQQLPARHLFGVSSIHGFGTFAFERKHTNNTFLHHIATPDHSCLLELILLVFSRLQSLAHSTGFNWKNTKNPNTTQPARLSDIVADNRWMAVLNVSEGKRATVPTRELSREDEMRHDRPSIAIITEPAHRFHHPGEVMDSTPHSSAHNENSTISNSVIPSLASASEIDSGWRERDEESHIHIASIAKTTCEYRPSNRISASSAESASVTSLHNFIQPTRPLVPQPPTTGRPARPFPFASKTTNAPTTAPASVPPTTFIASLSASHSTNFPAVSVSGDSTNLLAPPARPVRTSVSVSKQEADMNAGVASLTDSQRVRMFSVAMTRPPELPRGSLSGTDHMGGLLRDANEMKLVSLYPADGSGKEAESTRSGRKKRSFLSRVTFFSPCVGDILEERDSERKSRERGEGRGGELCVRARMQYAYSFLFLYFSISVVELHLRFEHCSSSLSIP
jgi:hypothetical protein